MSRVRSPTALYRGYRDARGTAHVIVADGVGAGPLNPRFDLANHSPTGFEWGYGGSGPAQLALALVADAIGDDEVALMTYQRFKWQIVAKLDRERWEMTASMIRTIAGKMPI